MPVIQMPEPKRDLATQQGLLTAPQLARMLGISRTAIYQLVKDGRIPDQLWLAFNQRMPGADATVGAAYGRGPLPG